MTFGDFTQNVPIGTGQKLLIFIDKKYAWRIKRTDFSKIAMFSNFEIEKIKACKCDDYIYVYLKGEQKNVR